MKILHCCLANTYNENYGYQENIISKIHKLQGYEVFIVASTEVIGGNKKNRAQQNLKYVAPVTFLNEHGIVVTRIPYKRYIPLCFSKKLRVYEGLSTVLNEFFPDIIFIHGSQFISISEIVHFSKENSNVRVFVDCHADYLNSGSNWISLNILHRIIYKYCTKLIEPYTISFYGTLPLRCSFLRDVYDVDAAKIKLLEMGADDTEFSMLNKPAIRQKVRQKYNLNLEDFVVITGGKITKLKEVDKLLSAFQIIKNEKIKLIVFGSIDAEMMGLTKDLLNQKNIRYVSWLNTKEIYEVILSSDLGFFPGQHSALWEQFLGCGVPCVFRDWGDMEHLVQFENSLFISDISSSSISNLIQTIFSADDFYFKLKSNSEKFCLDHFSYSRIAQKAIENF